MAITRTYLNNLNSGTNAATYASNSINPTNGALGLAWITSALTSTIPAAPASLVGNNGNHWTQLYTVGLGTFRMTLYKCLFVNPTAGAVTVTFAATQQRCAGMFMQVTTNTSGATILLGTPVGVTQAGGTSISVTLTGSASYVALGVGRYTNPTEAIGAESGYVLVGTQVQTGTETMRIGLIDRHDGVDLTPAATVATSSSAAGIGVSAREEVGAPAYVVRQQFYNEAGSGSAISFTPSVAPTVGHTLVVCLSIDHFETPTYAAGNGYTLMTDPAVGTMDYPINNNAFDRQRWYSKVATGTDAFTFTSSTGVSGWNLSYWELDDEYVVGTVLSTYSGATSTNTQDPAAIANPSSSNIAYLIGWSGIHFGTAADPVGFSGTDIHTVTDRGDVASTGGTKVQTSAADKSVSDGYILNQDAVISATAMTGVRNTAVAMIPSGPPPTLAYPDVVVGGAKKTVANMSVIVGGVKKPVTSLSVVQSGAKKPVV